MKKECKKCNNNKTLICMSCTRSTTKKDYFDPIKTSRNNVIKVDFINKQIIK